MADADIVLNVITNGASNVVGLSNAMQQLNRTVSGAVNPMRNLDARSKALSVAMGATNSSLKNHAKTVSDLTRNQAILSNELGRVTKEVAGLGKSYQIASGASNHFKKVAINDLRQYQNALKGIKTRALIEDLRAIGREQARLGKNAQFVGRSLIIGLTTPIVGFARFGLQALVATDRELVRLNKVLESVAPNAETAAKKIGVDLVNASDAQRERINAMVNSFNELKDSLTDTSIKYGVSRSLVVGLAADFAELGIQTTSNIAAMTELTAATEKLGGMDIGPAKDLVQSLYFQAVRAMQMSGELATMTAPEREAAAIGAARAQLALFNLVENQTALTLKDLGDAFPEVAAAASSFGLSMTEAAAMLAPMKSAGFEVGASANAIKVSLQRLTAPTKQNAEMFKALSKQYKFNFELIKGTGVDAMQALIDAYNVLIDPKNKAGQEGVMEFFAKVFGVRQGPRMEIAISQFAQLDRILKSNVDNADLAEKQIQSIANSVISNSNKMTGANLPLIESFSSLGIIARAATASVDQEVEGLTKNITQQQIDAAIKIRDEIGKQIGERARKTGEDLIGQVGTEAGKVMFVQLAGVASAQAVADRELEIALASLETKIVQIRENFKRFASDLIDYARPAIEAIADATTKLYEAWNNLSPAIKKGIIGTATALAALAASIGPLVFIFGQFRLAMGTVGDTLLRFLPRLKTMSTADVAAKSAMLRLTKPLTLVGDVVENNNTRFTTFIATLASGGGPIAKLADRFGVLTGRLQKLNTASIPLQKGVAAKRAEQMMALDDIGQLGGGKGLFKKGPTSKFTVSQRAAIAARAGLGTRPEIQSETAKNIIARFGSDKALRGGSAQATRNVNKAVREETFRILEEAGFTRQQVGQMIRQPTGLTRTIVGPASAKAMTNVQQAMGEIKSLPRRTRDFDAATKQAMKVESGKMRALSRRGIDYDFRTGETSFKGRQISQQRASDIYRGGLGGARARVAEFAGRRGEAVAGAFKFDRGPIQAYKDSIGAAKKALIGLNAQHAAAGADAPRFFAKMSTAIRAFTSQTTIATKAMKLLKFAMISSGIMVVLLAIAVAVKIVKDNFEKFASSGKKGMDAVGRVINIFKSIVEELARPIVDLFSSFGDGAEGAQGAASGIGVAFNGLMVAVEFVAKGIKWFVVNVIQRWLYAIVNLVKGVVNLFQGNWKDGLKAIAAYFGIIWGGIAKLVIKVAAFLVKRVVDIFFQIPKALVKGFAWGITKLTDMWYGLVEFIINQVKKIPVLGKVFGGVGDAALSGLRRGRDVLVGAVNALGDGIGSAGTWINKQIDQGAKIAANFIDSISKSQIKMSKGKVFDDKKGKKKTPQEKIPTGGGTGIEEAAETFADKLKEALKDAAEDLAKTIFSNLEKSIDKVSSSFVKILEKQKKESVKVFDEQLRTIDTLRKAEESLTKTKEYEQKKRELLEERALNRENYLRNRRLAIYEGRVDDARMLDLEERKSRDQSLKDLGSLEESRRKELAEENFNSLVETINKAKDKAEEFFDASVDAFEEAAKKITQFPPRTVEEFQKQMSELEALAKKTANENGSSFGTMVNDMAKSLIEDLPNKTSGLFGENLGKLVEEAKAKYGLGTTEGDNTSIIGSTLLMLKGVAGAISGDTTVTSAFSGLTSGINTSIETIGNYITGTTLPGVFTDIAKVLSENDPFTVYTQAVKDAIEEITYKITTGNLEMSITFATLETQFPQLKGAIDKLTEAIRLNTAIKEGKELAPVPTPTPTFNPNEGWTLNSGLPTIDFSNFDFSTIDFTALDLFAGVPEVPTPVVSVPEVPQLDLDLSGIDFSWLNDWIGGINFGIGTVGFANGGLIPGVKSSAVPIMAHGGEFVVNSKAVENVGLATLQQINNMRFNKPTAPNAEGVGSSYSEQNINIYVDNFIGQKSWFESMMKEYNLKVVPASEKAAGLQDRTITTYTGINRGM